MIGKLSEETDDGRTTGVGGVGNLGISPNEENEVRIERKVFGVEGLWQDTASVTVVDEVLGLLEQFTRSPWEVILADTDREAPDPKLFELTTGISVGQQRVPLCSSVDLVAFAKFSQLGNASLEVVRGLELYTCSTGVLTFSWRMELLIFFQPNGRCRKTRGGLTDDSPAPACNKPDILLTTQVQGHLSHISEDCCPLENCLPHPAAASWFLQASQSWSLGMKR